MIVSLPTRPTFIVSRKCLMEDNGDVEHLSLTFWIEIYRKGLAGVHQCFVTCLGAEERRALDAFGLARLLSLCELLCLPQLGASVDK